MRRQYLDRPFPSKNVLGLIESIGWIYSPGCSTPYLSLWALAHFDFNQAGAYAYEQALLTIRQLELPMAAVEEQFRRMVFNVVARNQDDHVKNIAFLMNKRGDWSLAPAFDVTYSYNPSGSWTATHQMTLNGKRDDFTRADFLLCAKSALMKRGRAETIIEEVQAAVKRWPEFAAEARLGDEWRGRIQAQHRLTFPER
jgi:serine/threonine-protein kinase HipA